MIIIYDKANTLSLPYVENKAVKYHKFIPGKNEIASEAWKAICEYNEQRMEHYARFLHPLNEEAAGDAGLDYEALTAYQVSELVENTMEVSDLEALKDYENKRDKPRKSVLSAIDRQIKAISDFEEKVEKGE